MQVLLATFCATYAGFMVVHGQRLLHDKPAGLQAWTRLSHADHRLICAQVFNRQLPRPGSKTASIDIRSPFQDVCDVRPHPSCATLCIHGCVCCMVPKPSLLAVHSLCTHASDESKEPGT